jgi:ABC-type uncharacterized transport system ATPase subunit
VLAHVDLTLAAGEIRGVAGVDGNGQDEPLEARAGAIPRRGTVVVPARRSCPATSGRARRGVALIPGDRSACRARRGALRLGERVPAAPLPLASRTSAVSTSRAPALRGRPGAHPISVRAPSLTHPIGALSGGNQQRVVIAARSPSHRACSLP